MENLSEETLYRIIDVNFNRAIEAIRVCEEITRFILNDKKLTIQFRNIRHKIPRLDGLFRQYKIIKKRDSNKDVGRKLISGELKRNNYQDIFFANIQRAKESVRVLEEFYKLINISTAIKFKKIRYNIYGIEKQVAVKLLPIFNTRQKLMSSRRCR